MSFLEQSFHVRDTLVDKTTFNSLPEAQRVRILELRREFVSIGYIDARTEVGPCQWRRTTSRQKKQIESATTRAFRIEDEIKALLRTAEQQQLDGKLAEKKKLEASLYRINNEIEIHEKFNARLINSKRGNATKKVYESLLRSREELRKALEPN